MFLTSGRLSIIYVIQVLFVNKIGSLGKIFVSSKKNRPPQVGVRVPGHHLAVVSIILIFNNILMFTILS